MIRRRRNSFKDFGRFIGHQQKWRVATSVVFVEVMRAPAMQLIAVMLVALEMIV
jgi:hypothetical protein